MKNLKNKNIFIIIFVYILIKIIFNDELLLNNILNQILWLMIIIYFIWDIKNSFLRLNKNRKLFVFIIVISLISLVVYFYMGFIFGFLKSPYSHEFIPMLKNILMELIMIVGVELTRNVLAIRNKNNKVALIFLTILLILAEINYNTLFSLFVNKEEFFEYICSNVLPTIACGILYTYLTLKGSFSVVLVYRLFKEILVFVLLILPDFNWFITGSIDILHIVLVYILCKYYLKIEKNDIKTKNNFSEIICYILTFVFSLLLILFMLGVFKYEAISILSNSMAPTFNRGDIVVFEKISEDRLNKIPKNTIIVYSIGNQNIVHRVVDIVRDENDILYKTKGDSNNMADRELVKTSQIKGIYKFNVKYVGFPSVWLHDYFIKENAKVEVK